VPSDVILNVYELPGCRETGVAVSHRTVAAEAVVPGKTDISKSPASATAKNLLFIKIDPPYKDIFLTDFNMA
jgi:hypothetical protein